MSSCYSNKKADYVFHAKRTPEDEVFDAAEERSGGLLSVLDLVARKSLANVLLEGLRRKDQQKFRDQAPKTRTGQSVQDSSERSLLGSTVSTGTYW